MKCIALTDNQNAGCRARGDRSDRLTNDRAMGGEDAVLKLGSIEHQNKHNNETFV